MFVAQLETSTDILQFDLKHFCSYFFITNLTIFFSFQLLTIGTIATIILMAIGLVADQEANRQIAQLPVFFRNQATPVHLYKNCMMFNLKVSFMSL